MTVSNNLLKAKLLAMLSHITVSMMFIGIAILLILFQWYPEGLFTLDGGLYGLSLIILVDLILGPALTFVVYKPNKPKLLFDLFCIGVFQLAAYFGGMYQIYTQQPRLLVIYQGELNILTQAQVDRAFIPAATLMKISENSKESALPPIVYLPAPTNFDEMFDYNQLATSRGRPVALGLGDHYLYERFENQLRSDLHFTDKLGEHNIETYREFSAQNDLDIDDLFPLFAKGRFGYAIAIYDLSQKSISGFIPIDKQK